MSVRTWMSAGMLAVAAVMAAAPDAGAQGLVIGTFRWQLEPYCNVLTLTVVQLGSQYHVDGTDDLCGASRLASVVGRGFPNPDGTIGFGLTTVTTTGGLPVHIDARFTLPSLGGPWADSAGNSGAFTFTPGAGTGGSPRPVPAGGIGPGTITGSQIAAGAVGVSQLAPAAVTYLDGRYLQHAQPIVMAESAGNWRVQSTGTPDVFEVLGPLMTASGKTGVSNGWVDLSLPLTAPVSVGGTSYRLSQVEYCIRTIAATVKVDSASVFSDAFVGAVPLRQEVTDPTDYTVAGVCPVLAVPATAERSYALVLKLAYVGGATSGSVIISGVRSTWVPTP